MSITRLNEQVSKRPNGSTPNRYHRKILTTCLLCGFSLITAMAQQRPDTAVELVVDTPYYAAATGPRVGIDGAHNNIHQLESGFAPFARLLALDGCQPLAVDAVMEANLANLEVFVVVNPIHASNRERWKRPILAAFTTEEIACIEKWVRAGGRLLVIADHMPCAGAAATLAAKFGFTYLDGFTLASQQTWPPDRYSKAAGTLLETPVTIGIDSLASFTGSALKAPAGAIPVATFPEGHRILIPKEAWKFTKKTPVEPVDGYLMGALLEYGAGRVACFTEAAMFTAQTVQDGLKVGFNSPHVPQNQQFVRNVIHWLYPR